METLKKNVSVFNDDVTRNGGYVYTTNARVSSVLSLKRSREAILSMIGSDVSTVIDIGTGDGAVIYAISQEHPGLKITAVDPAADAIKEATRKYPDIHFAVCDILDTAFTPPPPPPPPVLIFRKLKIERRSMPNLM